MTFKRATEKRAMTLEMLVANVGGILGLFLGISCLSAISGVQFLIEEGLDLREKWRTYIANRI